MTKPKRHVCWSLRSFAFSSKIRTGPAGDPRDDSASACASLAVASSARSTSLSSSRTTTAPNCHTYVPLAGSSFNDSSCARRYTATIRSATLRCADVGELVAVPVQEWPDAVSDAHDGARRRSLSRWRASRSTSSGRAGSVTTSRSCRHCRMVVRTSAMVMSGWKSAYRRRVTLASASDIRLSPVGCADGSRAASRCMAGGSILMSCGDQSSVLFVGVTCVGARA
jgi:hypothetical protein